MPRDGFEVNAGEMTRYFNRVNDQLENAKPLLSEIGAFVKSQIDIRTAQGKDVSGQPFKPYTPEYSLFRSEAGHSTTPNLFFSGSMMSSMTYTSNENTAHIFFMPTTDRKGVSNPAKAFFLNQKRNFFAMSETEIDKVTQIADEYVGRTLRG